MAAAQQIAPRLGAASTCAALGVAKATYYRRRKPRPAAVTVRPSPPRTLPTAERTAVLDLLHEPRFVDLAPAQVYATLLDEQRYLCSVRTMYRILEENQEVRERRNQRRHPNYAAPQLLATAPNQLWSWDITSARPSGPTSTSTSSSTSSAVTSSAGWSLTAKPPPSQRSSFAKLACARASFRDSSPFMPIVARR